MNTKMIQAAGKFSSGKFDEAFPFVDKDVRWNLVGSEPVEGKDSLIATCCMMQREMEDLNFNITERLVSGDYITILGYCNYKGKAEYGRVEYCDVYKFENDLVKEINSYCIEIKPVLQNTVEGIHPVK